MAAKRAVIFDVGGVLTRSPVAAIRAHAEEQGADYAVLGPLLAHPESAWSRFEKSELTPEEFSAAFEQECLAAGLTLASGPFLQSFGNLTVRPEMVAVVEHLRGRVALAAITNNVHRNEHRPTALYDLFEVVIESAKVGLRKPDPRIYLLACERLGVAPEESVFLDDFGVNLKAARALRMATIKVDETTSAIDELENLLEIPLPRVPTE